MTMTTPDSEVPRPGPDEPDESADPALDTPTAAPEIRDPWTERYQSPVGRMKAARNGLRAVMAVLALSLVNDVVTVLLVGGFGSGVDSGVWRATDQAGTCLYSLIRLVFLLAGLLFIRWHRSMLRNLVPLGCPTLDYGVTFASWSWIIPVVNWVVPYRSIRQIARWSQPTDGEDGQVLVAVWWATWLGQGFITTVGALGQLTATETAMHIVWGSVNVLGSAVLLLSGFLALRVLALLTRQQTEFAESAT